MDKPLRYLSYLLRLWQTGDRGKLIWRASLESPGTGERHGFASIGELLSFLQARMQSPDDQTCRIDSNTEIHRRLK